MNLKQRGVTVGDLLLLIILIILISFVSIKYKENKQQTSFLSGLQFNKIAIFK